jgi:hypothetical protein
VVPRYCLSVQARQRTMLPLLQATPAPSTQPSKPKIQRKQSSILMARLPLQNRTAQSEQATHDGRPNGCCLDNTAPIGRTDPLTSEPPSLVLSGLRVLRKFQSNLSTEYAG